MRANQAPTGASAVPGRPGAGAGHGAAEEAPGGLGRPRARQEPADDREHEPEHERRPYGVEQERREDRPERLLRDRERGAGQRELDLVLPYAMASRTTTAPITIAMPTAMVMRARRRATSTATTNSSSTP